ncbi:hypothetical protein MRS44_018180 [Fusarium solani]|uniref:uncharacterized protein n=1 Tax=Fusarium solani TaxID=169388 RepID=UPI0032C49544|nr:hypothetical protein MRS44_018180 [Fusarium solani]
MGRRRYSISCGAVAFWFCIDPQLVPVGGLPRRVKGLRSGSWPNWKKHTSTQSTSPRLRSAMSVDPEQIAVGPYVARREEQIFESGDFGEQLRLVGIVQGDEPRLFQALFQRLAVTVLRVKPDLELGRVPRDPKGKGFTQLVSIAAKKKKLTSRSAGGLKSL